MNAKISWQKFNKKQGICIDKIFIEFKRKSSNLLEKPARWNLNQIIKFSITSNMT